MKCIVCNYVHRYPCHAKSKIPPFSKLVGKVLAYPVFRGYYFVPQKMSIHLYDGRWVFYGTTTKLKSSYNNFVFPHALLHSSQNYNSFKKYWIVK